ncbi:MAG: metallophosphoesterase [Pirellulaceae bacterium]
MSGQAIRFIHTSDFHLERPVGGIAEVPSHLREAFVEAPYLAAERVFDSAIKEKVDFVILAGDILDVELAGPRAVDFLVTQFNRLKENKIRVYWAGGKVDDPELWPAEIRLPKNVHVFSTSSPQEIEFKRNGRTVLTLVGQSHLDG